jgi:hypothetical protein
MGQGQAENLIDGAGKFLCFKQAEIPAHGVCLVLRKGKRGGLLSERKGFHGLFLACDFERDFQLGQEGRREQIQIIPV